MRQALRQYGAFLTQSLGGISECGSMSIFISKREKESRRILKKERAFTPVVLVVRREPPRGVNTTAFTTYSRDWLPPRAKHFVLLSLTLLRADDSCSRAAL